jgi:hypothetical protein
MPCADKDEECELLAPKPILQREIRKRIDGEMLEISCDKHLMVVREKIGKFLVLASHLGPTNQQPSL